MPAPIYTTDQFDRMCEMRERGVTIATIGRVLKMSPSAVSWHCLRLGADSPKTSISVQESNHPMVVKRNGKDVRRFTDSEDQIILDEGAKGTCTAHIAQKIGRRWNSTRGRMMTLARRDARMENIKLAEGKL